ncbi:MAG: heme exporter protein CcmB [Gammaproteobacteria bacterium]|nr:heme exporter protein CcmB [Gammaproteobacteria bacterium]
MTAVRAMLQRDLRLAWRRRGDLLLPVLFFVLVASLFPLAVGAEPQRLQSLAPGIVWVAALLAALLALETLFRDDFADGSLDQLLLSPGSLSALVGAKVLAHWLVSALPLVLLAPLLAVLFRLPDEAMSVLVVSLLLGTPVLSLLGAVCVALTVGLRRGGFLLTLLVLPLYVPVLIFAAGSVATAAVGASPAAHLYFLAALLVLAATLTPFAIAAALRIGAE